MHVSELLGQTVTVDFKGMSVTFQPSAYTFADQEALMGLADNNPDAWRKLRDMLGRVLVSWDLEDDQGPIPTTSEGMERLPLTFLLPLMEALGEVMRPTEDEKKDLNAVSVTLPSASTKQPLESQGGTNSSAQPDTSASPPGSLPVSPSAG